MHYLIKLRHNNDSNNVMMGLYGITKIDTDKYLLVVEYAEGGTLRNYLEKNFLSLNWINKYELAIQLSVAVEFLHERGIVHKDLHSRSILVHQNSIRLADSGLSKRINNSSQTWLDTIPYSDPRGFDIEEMSSGAFELNEKSDVYSVGVLLWELSSGKKPFSDKVYNSFLAKEITQGLREVIVDGTPKGYYNLYKKCWNEPSKQAVFTEDGELNISLCEDQPLLYTSINDRNSRKNLLSFNSADDSDVELDDSLQPSDIFINFPVAEITYIFDLSESFSNFMDDDKGNSYLNWVHDSTRYKKEISFDNLFALDFFPKIITTDGINLDTREQLTDWMNNLFHDDRVEIISYNNLVPISQLKSETTLLEDEIQLGVANFKEKLTLENWVKNSKYAKWVEEFQLLRGLIIDQSSESRISNENTIDLINIPDVNSNDKFYLKIVKPTTILDEILINDNIISTNSDEDISSFPFIKVSDDLSYEDRVHFLVKGYRKALESMEPLIHLQAVFDEYGHLIPLNIVLGKSLKNTIENSSYISKRIDLASPVFESLKSHLADFSIPCLLT
ncbi:Tpk3p [Rhizophagus irregularis DAOM 197198w]|uniref:Tpk3p n=1 Tax=Rhizophagus irregularis (strain DAOM 197198w) TaxID=1432141 RepID=A0A015LJ75_RHIIW|nr:Tpk3p [Rhizophagus irregularis DAOM 197198w]